MSHKTTRPRVKVPPGEWTKAYVEAFNAAPPLHRVDLEKVAARRPEATLADLASAADLLGLTLHVAMRRSPAPAKKPRRKGKR